MSAAACNSPRNSAKIVIKTDNGRITRLKDVARVELGAESYGMAFRLDGKPAAGIQIFQSPEANALATAERIEAKMDELARAFPPGLTYTIPFDATKSVRASIHEVYKTLIEAAVLVLLVIIVFVQDWRAILVPATTVPVTIIGAFAAMAAFGFTVNLASLFAVVLAIGIVVDDAIVIVEGASRHIEAGMSRRDAAIKAMDELFGPIIGITLVLMAVFIPAAFLPGPSGQMYRAVRAGHRRDGADQRDQRGDLKADAMRVVARRPVPRERRNLVLSRLQPRLRPDRGAAICGLSARITAAQRGNGGCSRSFSRGISVWGVVRLPTAFIPLEDQGYLMVAVQLPDGASLERTEKALARVRDAARAIPGVDQVVEISGLSLLESATLSNAGAMWVVLKDWGARGPGRGSRRDPCQADAGGRRAARRAGLRVRPAADPEPREHWRLHDASRAARRQLRLCRTVQHRPHDRRECRGPIGPGGRRHVVSRERAADSPADRPHKGGAAEGFGR